MSCTFFTFWFFYSVHLFSFMSNDSLAQGVKKKGQDICVVYCPRAVLRRMFFRILVMSLGRSAGQLDKSLLRQKHVPVVAKVARWKG